MTMDTKDLDKLDELVTISTRVADLMDEASFSDDENIDTVEAIKRLRLSGANEDADELAELFQRIDEMKSR